MSDWDDFLETAFPTEEKKTVEDPFPEIGGKPSLLGQDFAVSTKFPDIQGMVLDYFDELDKSSENREHVPAFYPSTIAGASCKHLYYWHYTEGRSKTFAPSLRIIMDNGTDCHSRWQRYLAKHLLGTWSCDNCHAVINENKAYDAIKPNKKTISLSDTPIAMPDSCPECGHTHLTYEEWRIVSEEFGYRGKIDGIIETPTGWVGLEIKSASPASFDKFKGDYWLMEVYKKQFGLYLDHLNISRGLFLIENKGTQNTLTIPVLLSDIDLSEMKENMLLVKNAKSVDDLGVPVWNKDCENCIYRNRECKVNEHS